MGGHISAAYTLSYPEQVKSLVLLNAAGLKVGKTPYMPNEKIISNEKEFDEGMKELFYTVPDIPTPFKLHFIEQSQRNFAWFNKIRSDIRTGKDHLLNDRVAQIKTPTFILWGSHDSIVSPKVGQLYHAKIASSQWLLFDKCGHLPHYERPQQTAEVILDFLHKQ